MDLITLRPRHFDELRLSKIGREVFAAKGGMVLTDGGAAIGAGGIVPLDDDTGLAWVRLTERARAYPVTVGLYIMRAIRIALERRPVLLVAAKPHDDAARRTIERLGFRRYLGFGDMAETCSSAGLELFERRGAVLSGGR